MRFEAIAKITLAKVPTAIEPASERFTLMPRDGVIVSDSSVAGSVIGFGRSDLNGFSPGKWLVTRTDVFVPLRRYRTELSLNLGDDRVRRQRFELAI
jgi:hypothetical protein